MKSDVVNAEAVLKNLFVQITDTHIKQHFTIKDIMTALAEIMALAEHIVQRTHEAETDDQIECRSGCSYCCHSQIKLTPAEALLIFFWINSNFTDKQIAALKQRISQNQFLTRGKNLRERVRIKDTTPCIFLDKGSCSIYPVRPFICRGWTSYSRKACKDAFHSGNHTAEIESSAPSNYVFFCARETVRQVCRHRGLECEPLVLPEAMDICFCSRSPFSLWLQKKPLFIDRDFRETESHATTFMDVHVPIFLNRFSLSYHRDGSCIEYFLYSKEKQEEISTELIISHDTHANALYVSKFYPEIYKQPLRKYMSAACFFLMVHHAALTSGIHKDCFISLETRNPVFDSFYSKLKDFEFSIKYRRASDNCNVRGNYHFLHIDTSMITHSDHA